MAKQEEGARKCFRFQVGDWFCQLDLTEDGAEALRKTVESANANLVTWAKEWNITRKSMNAIATRGRARLEQW